MGSCSALQDFLYWPSPEKCPSPEKMVFLLDKQTGAHKSNMYFKKICLFSLQWLFLLSSVNTWCNLLSTATDILHFPFIWWFKRSSLLMHRDVWRRQCTVAALAQSPGLVKCWGGNVHCGVRYRCLPAIAESNDLASIKQIKTCCNICSFDLGYGSTSALVIWPQKKPCFLRKSSTVPPFCAKPLGDFLWFIHMVLIQSTFQYTSLKRSFKSLQEKPKHEKPHLKK